MTTAHAAALAAAVHAAHAAHAAATLAAAALAAALAALAALATAATCTSAAAAAALAELCTHRHVESGELGVVTSAFSTTLRDARAHRGRRVLRSLPHAKMHTARPDRCVEWAIA